MTERHSSGETLLAAGAGVRGLCHALEDPVAVISLPQGTLLEVNRAFREAVDLPDPLPDGCSLLELSGPVLARALHTWDRGGPLHFAHAALKGVVGRLALVPMTDAGLPQAFVHFLPRPGRAPAGHPDPLEGLLDERLEQIRTFERLRSLGEVAAIMVHGLRTPVTSIRFALEEALRTRACDAAVRRRIDVALEQVDRMDRLLSGIRDFSRPAVLAFQRIDVRETISAALRAVEGLLLGPQTTVTVEVKPDPLLVLADPERLIEAIQNVVVNAVEARPQGGLVSIAATTDPHRRDWVEIRVTDHGPGIAPEVMKRLFRPFFTTKPGGTGLGLSIVKKIADLHGGSVSLKTEPGKGATVTLQLPGVVAV